VDYIIRAWVTAVVAIHIHGLPHTEHQNRVGFAGFFRFDAVNPSPNVGVLHAGLVKPPGIDPLIIVELLYVLTAVFTNDVDAI